MKQITIRMPDALYRVFEEEYEILKRIADRHDYKLDSKEKYIADLMRWLLCNEAIDRKLANEEKPPKRRPLYLAFVNPDRYTKK